MDIPLGIAEFFFQKNDLANLLGLILGVQYQEKNQVCLITTIVTVVNHPPDAKLVNLTSVRCSKKFFFVLMAIYW